VTLAKSREDGATSWNSRVPQCVQLLSRTYETTLTLPPHRAPRAKQNGTKRVLFDVPKDGQNIAPKHVAPEDEQEPYESRRYVIAASKLRSTPFPVRLGDRPLKKHPPRLWHELTQAIEAKDMEAATRAKTAVEDAQRDLRRRRDESGEVFVPRYFQLRDGRWCPKLRCVVAIPPLAL